MISLNDQTKLYHFSENWELIIHPVTFEDLLTKYRSFYKLRYDSRYEEDEDAQDVFQPFSSIFSKINNCPLPYSSKFFEIESLEEKLLQSSLHNTHEDLYKELLTYCDFFQLLKETNTNPLLTVLQEEINKLLDVNEDLSKTAFLIKKSYSKDYLLENLSEIIGQPFTPKILTHSELVNSQSFYNNVFSFGPFYDLTPHRESRVLLSPKFKKMHLLSNNIKKNLELKQVSLLGEDSGFPLSKTFHIPEPEFKEIRHGPELNIDSKDLPVVDLSEKEEIKNLVDLEKAETEEYLINEGIKKRGERKLDEVLVSAVIFHLSHQCSFLVPDENVMKFIDSEELDTAKAFGQDTYKLADISKEKPEKVSSGDAILIFEGGEGTYTSDLSKKRLGKKYDLITDSLKRWKSELNNKIDNLGLKKASRELKDLGVKMANPINVRNWSDYQSGGPGNRNDFSLLLNYLSLDHHFLPFSKNLEQWRREHQKSGRELSKKITSSIKARGLQSLKEEGYAEFEMQGYEGPHVSAYVVNSCEIVHHIPLSSTKKLIRKNSG